MSEYFDEERKRMTEIAMANRVPCIVCSDPNIVGTGTWIPDKKHELAAGKKKDSIPLFAFCLCAVHAEPTLDNETLIIRAILRDVRTGNKFTV